jgi:hypothetical protein
MNRFTTQPIGSVILTDEILEILFIELGVLLGREKPMEEVAKYRERLE